MNRRNNFLAVYFHFQQNNNKKYRTERRPRTPSVYSARNSGTFETGKMVWKLSWKGSGKSENCWISKISIIQLTIRDDSGKKIRWDGNFPCDILENLGIPREVVLLIFWNFQNCCFIRHGEFLEMQIEIFWSKEKGLSFCAGWTPQWAVLNCSWNFRTRKK